MGHLGGLRALFPVSLYVIEIVARILGAFQMATRLGLLIADDNAGGKGAASHLVDGQSAHVRFGSKADIRAAKSHVRFTPESGHVRCN
jgi:hypothetical protein